jgi:hypothetical protein
MSSDIPESMKIWLIAEDWLLNAKKAGLVCPAF